MCDGRGIIDREVCERCRGTGSATVDSIPLVDDLALAGVAPTSPASPARVVTFKRSGTQVCVGNLSKGKMGSGQTPTGFTDVRIDRQTALGNPFPMGSDGHDETYRDAVCEACDELLADPGGSDVSAIARRHGLRVYPSFAATKDANPQVKLAEAMQELEKRVCAGESLRLMCWCYPKRCHGDSIAKALRKRVGESVVTIVKHRELPRAAGADEEMLEGDGNGAGATSHCTTTSHPPALPARVVTSKRKAWPEGYVKVRPSYLHLTLPRLDARWRQAPSLSQPPVLFYSPADEWGIFSNWHNGKSFTFTLPPWCLPLHREKDFQLEFKAAFAEKAIMACKAALMGDVPHYGQILRARSPRDAKALGKQVAPFDDALWRRRVCAVAVAVLTAKREGDVQFAQLLDSTHPRLLAEAAPRDLVWGIGLAANETGATDPRRWRGSNVLGWALMEVRGLPKPWLEKAPSPPRAVQAAGTSGPRPSKQARSKPLGTASDVPSSSSTTAASPLPTPSTSGTALGLAKAPLVSLTEASPELLQLMVFLVIITTVGEPLVFTPADGDQVLGLPMPADQDPSLRRRGDRAIERGEATVKAHFPRFDGPIIPAGLTHDSQAPVLAFPIRAIPDERVIVRTQEARRSRKSCGFLFLSIAALAGTPAYSVVGPALARVNSFVRPSFGAEARLAGAAPMNALRFVFGSREVASLIRYPPSTPALDPQDKGMLCERIHGLETNLQLALRNFPGDGDIPSYVRESAGSIEFLNPDNVPDAFCRDAVEFDDPALDHLPFEFSCPVPITDFTERLPNQPATCDACAARVNSCAEFILPSANCQGLVDEWWANATHDFELLRNGERLEGRRRTRTVALGDNCFLPCAHGCWFDCRRQSEGIVTTLRYDQDVDSQLDREYVASVASGWPDQAIISSIYHGAVITPPMPHILVLCPQLLGLADGFALVQSELAKLVKRKWYGLFEGPAFFPGHHCPKGCEKRKLESCRPRPTTDGSNPPCCSDGQASVFDTMGEPVFSPNYRARHAFDRVDVPEREPDAEPDPDAEASDEEEGTSWQAPRRGQKRFGCSDHFPPDWQARTSSRWPENWWRGMATGIWYGRDTPEFKPTLRGAARDSAILTRPGRCLREPRFQAGDDWKNAFMHLRTRPEAWPRSMTLAYSHPELEVGGTPRMLFVAEYVLGFGHTYNSGLFQRLASFVQHLVMAEMDRLEAPRLRRLAIANPCFRKWLEERAAVSARTFRNEARLYTLHIYTDDPHAICVGAEGVINFLRAWRLVNSQLRMMPALAAKRKIGTQIMWLGALPNAHLGYLSIPPAKLLRVQEALAQALKSQLTLTDYRSLMGFLEWVAWCFSHARQRFFGLYRPFQPGQEVTTGPATLVKADPKMVAKLQWWIDDLKRLGGVSMASALPRRRRTLPMSAPTYFVSVDAAKDGTDTPGIAGWLHGWTWSYLYDLSWLQLPISVLELMALAVSVIVFQPYLQTAPNVVFDTDSLTAQFDLEKEAAKAPLMQAAFGPLLESQEWDLLIVQAGLERERSVRHVKGKLNIFADAESRGYVQMSTSWANQLGVERKQIPLSCAAVHYLNEVVDRAAPLLPGALKGLDVSPACSQHDGPSGSLEGVHHAPLLVPIDGAPGGRTSSATRSLLGWAPVPPSSGNEPQPFAQPPGGPSAPGLMGAPQPVIPRIPTWGPATASPAGSSLFHEAMAGALAPEYQQSGMQVMLRTSAAPPQQTGGIYDVAPPRRLWDEFQTRRAEALALAIPPSTTSANNSHWRFWIAHCAMWGCKTPLRDDHDAMSGRDPAGFQRELDLAASFVLDRQYTMQPRAKGTIPKPDSAKGSYVVVRRVFGKRVPKLPLDTINQMVKGLNRKLLREFGLEMLLVRRKQPPTNEVHLKLERGLPEGAKLGKYIYHRDAHFGKTWRLLLKIQEHAGFRKAEWSVYDPTASTFMLFRQFAYKLPGIEVPVRRPSKAQLFQILAIVNNGGEVWLLLYPVPSKCDPDGKRFCGKPIPMLLRRDDHECVVRLVAQMELDLYERGFTDEQRAQRPIFCDEHGQPLVGSAMDRALADALTYVCAPEVAKFISWHSWRIRLASKLMAAGADNPTIQSALRWASESAIAIYAKWEFAEYWKWLHKAKLKDTTAFQMHTLPEIDESRRLLDSLGLTGKSDDQIVSALYSDGTFDSASLPTMPSAAPEAMVAPAAQPKAPRPAASSMTAQNAPPGYHVMYREAKSRRYLQVVAPDGTKLTSLKKAWTHLQSNPFAFSSDSAGLTSSRRPSQAGPSTPRDPNDGVGTNVQACFSDRAGLSSSGRPLNAGSSAPWYLNDGVDPGEEARFSDGAGASSSGLPAWATPSAPWHPNDSVGPGKALRASKRTAARADVRIPQACFSDGAGMSSSQRPSRAGSGAPRYLNDSVDPGKEARRCDSAGASSSGRPLQAAPSAPWHPNDSVGPGEALRAPKRTAARADIRILEPAHPAHFELTRGTCGTLGCSLPTGHDGPCANEVARKRQRPVYTSC